MATDIKKLKNAQPIINGSMVVFAPKTGAYKSQTLNTTTTTSIESLESKYENRFKSYPVVIGG